MTRGRAWPSASRSSGSVRLGCGDTASATCTCSGPLLTVASVTGRPRAVRTTVPLPGAALISALTIPIRTDAGGVRVRLSQALASAMAITTRATTHRRDVVRKAADAARVRVSTNDQLFGGSTEPQCAAAREDPQVNQTTAPERPAVGR